jgi:hypothetical protein
LAGAASSLGVTLVTAGAWGSPHAPASVSLSASGWGHYEPKAVLSFSAALVESMTPSTE